MNRDPQPENRDPEPKHGNPEEKATVFFYDCRVCGTMYNSTKAGVPCPVCEAKKATVYTLTCDRCEQPFRTLNPRTRRCPACELTLRAR